MEAKSDTLAVGEGVGQAKLYAQKFDLATAYAANGKTIYQICLQTGKEGDVSAFPSPDELWHKTFGDRNAWHEQFDAVPIDTVNGDKQACYYQEIAVNKTMAAIAANQPRILLTLGTGKTFIASQIAWKLFQSRWNLPRDGKRQPRILFLADRKILANQAYLDFGSFSEDARTRIKPSEIKKRGNVPTNASVFFTIFQTFMSGDKNEPYFGQYPADFFDFIIVDECHRGGARDESTWRGILDYFHPAVQLGLTATPKRQDNADTYAYFGEPVYTYSLKTGIQDGFLTPFKVKRIQSSIDEYTYARDDEVTEGKVEEGKIYGDKDFNKTIEIDAREQKRVRDMLANINPNEKTLVFCANQAHAAKIRDFINQESDSTKVDYCVRVTADDGAIGDMHLRNCQDNDKTIPTILTTSYKLSPGVDARNIRNIILMRKMINMIECKQIIGRGTRLFEGKHFFTLIDFVDAYDFFNDPEWDDEPMERASSKPWPPKVDTIEKIKIKLSDGNEREITSTTTTEFMVDGNLIGVEAFVQKVFDSADKLRELWSEPDTRRQLLAGLEQAGCSKNNLLTLQDMLDAQNSDLFDVLEYISYARQPITRRERIAKAEKKIYAFLNSEQREFIEFVLNNYIEDGADELDNKKLGNLINSKYASNTDAEKMLGNPTQIKELFIGFQKRLYQQQLHASMQ